MYCKQTNAISSTVLSTPCITISFCVNLGVDEHEQLCTSSKQLYFEKKVKNKNKNRKKNLLFKSSVVTDRSLRTKVDQLQQRSILSTEKRKETLKLYDVSNYKKTEGQVSLHRPLNEENR